MTQEKQIEIDGVTFDVTFQDEKPEPKVGYNGGINIDEVKHFGVSFYEFISDEQLEEIKEKVYEAVQQANADRY